MLATPLAHDTIIRAAVAEWRLDAPNRTLFRELEAALGTLGKRAPTRHR